MDNIIYKKATKEDAYGVEFVAAHSWKETYSGFMPDEYLNNRILNIKSNYERTAKFIENADNYYVAEDNGKIVGILYFSKSEDEKFKGYGYLGAIYVLRDYQGMGIGKELFKIAINGIIDYECNDMYLECLKGNPSIGFYEKYGGKLIDEIDYPIRDFSVKADIIEFNDLKNILDNMQKNSSKKSKEI